MNFLHSFIKALEVKDQHTQVLLWSLCLSGLITYTFLLNFLDFICSCSSYRINLMITEFCLNSEIL